MVIYQSVSSTAACDSYSLDWHFEFSQHRHTPRLGDAAVVEIDRKTNLGFENEKKNNPNNVENFVRISLADSYSSSPSTTAREIEARWDV